MKYIPSVIVLLSIFLLNACQMVAVDAPPAAQNERAQEQAVAQPAVPNIEPLEPSATGTKPVSPSALSEQKDSFLDYAVPFVSQAPYEVWDEVHQEACEEAAMIMAVNFFQQKPTTMHTMEQGILQLVEWQEINGYRVDLSAEEVVRILKDYFAAPSRLLIDPSIDDIKAELLQGNLVIAPAAGRLLGNPYFWRPGPIYHMILIRGFDNARGEFITNDPGTKRGEAFRYPYQKLMSAIHNWDYDRAADGMTEEEMAQGSKIVVVVLKS